MPAEETRHARLAALLREMLRDDGYSPGDRFPSQNQLMRRFGLSYATVTRALNALVAEGHLVRQQGRGTFVASSPAPLGARTGFAPPKPITLFAPASALSDPTADDATLLACLRKELGGRWTATEIGWTDSEGSLDSHLFADSAAHGAVVVAPDARRLAFAARLARRLPCVAVGGLARRAPPGLSAVFCDLRAATERIVGSLFAQGHHAVGLIVPPTGADAEECAAGWAAAHAMACLDLSPALLVRAHRADGHGALLDLIDGNSNRPPTAVFVADPLLLAGAAEALRAMKPNAAPCPALTGLGPSHLRMPHREIARAALALLSALCDGASPPTHVSLDASPYGGTPEAQPRGGK